MCDESAEQRRQKIDRKKSLEQYRRELPEATKQLDQWEDEGGAIADFFNEPTVTRCRMPEMTSKDLEAIVTNLVARLEHELPEAYCSVTVDSVGADLRVWVEVKDRATDRVYRRDFGSEELHVDSVLSDVKTAIWFPPASR